MGFHSGAPSVSGGHCRDLIPGQTSLKWQYRRIIQEHRYVISYILVGRKVSPGFPASSQAFTMGTKRANYEQ